MKFDPTAPPFWEIERGEGPIMERMRSYSSTALADRIKDTEQKIWELNENIKTPGIHEKEKLILIVQIDQYKVKLERLVSQSWGVDSSPSLVPQEREENRRVERK